MKEILFSPIGFWSAFTIIAIFIGMGYFVVKMITLSGDKGKTLESDNDE